MAHPSPQAVAAIRSRVADWTPDDATIAAALNAPDAAYPNPVTAAPQLPKPFTVEEVFQAVAPTTIGKLNGVAFLPDIRDKLAANDIPGCALYASLLLAGGNITQADHDAIAAILGATEADPAWNADLSWAVATLGRPVDADDIAASRPGA